MTENNKNFVIQKHTKGRDVHWDLMLEAQDMLETYRLNMPPEEVAQGATTAAEKIFNHPLKFLTYEGSVNKGKGTVEIADTGTYQILNKTNTRVDFQFTGKILKGKFTLTLTKENRWEFGSDIKRVF